MPTQLLLGSREWQKRKSWEFLTCFVSKWLVPWGIPQFYWLLAHRFSWTLPKAEFLHFPLPGIISKRSQDHCQGDMSHFPGAYVCSAIDKEKGVKGQWPWLILLESLMPYNRSVEFLIPFRRKWVIWLLGGLYTFIINFRWLRGAEQYYVDQEFKKKYNPPKFSCLMHVWNLC